MRYSYNSVAARKVYAQQGLSLIVVLLFLICITSIAVLSARKAMLGEGSARNELEMEAARQAAESALRDAERDLSSVVLDAANISCTRPAVWSFDSTCPMGLCRLDSSSLYASSNWTAATAGSTTNSEPWWPTSKGGLWNNVYTTKPTRTPRDTANCTFTGGVPLGTFTGAAAIRGVVIQPEYLVEYFQKKISGGQEADAYRITARGFGYTRRTQVVMQTVFVSED